MSTPQNTPPSADNAPSTPRRSRWGRSRFGGSSRSLIAVSLLVGAALSLGVGWLISLAQTPGDQRTPWWLVYLIAVFVMLPVATMGTWALLVDRSTLAGAPEDPDASVESRWYDKAATGSFHTLIATLGLGAAVFAFLDVEVSPSLLLAVYFLIAAGSFGICYLIAKRADS